MNAALTEPRDLTVRAEVRFKNARLYNAIAAHAVVTAKSAQAQAVQRFGPIKPFCDFHDLPLETVYKLLNLHMKPLVLGPGGHGPLRLRPVCTRLAAILECEVDWLFPDELYALEWPTGGLVMDTSVERVRLAARATTLSLPAPQEDELFAVERRAELLKVLKTLTPREERIAILRWGLDGEGERTLAAVAQDFNCSIERIRQLETNLLRKLRHPVRARRLRGLLEATLLKD